MKKLARKKQRLGWYFADETETLRHGDGRKIKVGITHKVDCEPRLCEIGLHASKTVIGALQYAPGNILYRVRLSGKIVDGDDKSAATERKYLRRINAEPTLRAFTRQCALGVVHLWDAPPVVLEYLKTGDEKIRAAAGAAATAAARGASGGAAGAAAGAAATAAARGASWGAARAAAGAAATAAARGASLDAARVGAWAAAWGAKSKLLEKMITDALEKKRRNTK